MQLQRLVDHRKARIGGKALGHGAIGAGIGRTGIELAGSQAHHLARGDQLGGHVGQLELQRLKGRNRFAKLLALLHIALGVGQSPLRRAHRAGGNVDAPAVQPLHGNFETLALAPEQVVGGNAHIVKTDGARGLAVPAHFFFFFAVADARQMRRHGKRADAACARLRIARARHQHQHIGGTGAADKRLAAVDDVFAAHQLGAGFDAGRIRAAARFRQAVAGQFLAAGECLAPFGAHRIGGPGAQHPGRHVVDGDEGRGAGINRRQLLKHQGGIQPGQLQAANALGRIQAAKAQLARFGDGLHREDALGIPVRSVRGQLGLGKLPRRIGKGALVFVEFKIHTGLLILIAISAYK